MIAGLEGLEIKVINENWGREAEEEEKEKEEEEERKKERENEK